MSATPYKIWKKLEVLTTTSPHLSLFSVFLVTVHDPICTDTVDLSLAFHGSFLPIPSNELFSRESPETYTRKNAPGAVVVRKEPITLNAGREQVKLRVTNKGDRPIQV